MADIELKEFGTQWVFAQYELGRSVAEIAAEMKKSEAFVYAKLRLKPETYEDVKRIREEQFNRRLRRVSGLADKFILDYLEELQKRKDNPNLSAEDRANVFKEIDQVAKIAKQYADRLLLAEGKPTENVSVRNEDIPIQVIIHKTYEKDDARSSPV
jgi:hypothetical protein